MITSSWHAELIANLIKKKQTLKRMFKKPQPILSCQVSIISKFYTEDFKISQLAHMS